MKAQPPHTCIGAVLVAWGGGACGVKAARAAAAAAWYCCTKFCVLAAVCAHAICVVPPRPPPPPSPPYFSHRLAPFCHRQQPGRLHLVARWGPCAAGILDKCVVSGTCAGHRVPPTPPGGETKAKQVCVWCEYKAMPHSGGHTCRRVPTLQNCCVQRSGAKTTG